MKFASEQLTDSLFEEFMPLFQKHFAEIAHWKDIPLAPDYEAYKKVFDAGMLKVFTARNGNDNQMLGYNVFFLRMNMHYTSSPTASQDLMYLDPSIRKQGFGSSFISWCDAQLAAQGIQVVYYHVKAKHDFGGLLEEKGYELIDLVYGRRLDG